MIREELLIQLEELAGRLNIQVQYESVKSEDPSTFGGYCRSNDQHMIILHSKASTGRKIEIITDALKRFDIDDVYLLPALREHLKKDDLPGGHREMSLDGEGGVTKEPVSVYYCPAIQSSFKLTAYRSSRRISAFPHVEIHEDR